MLTTSYTFLAKIVANKVKKIIARLMNKQKNDFIPYRNIFYDIMAFKLVHEHAKCTHQEAHLFKLDNEKACDQVLPNFLWDTLVDIGFDLLLIRLIKGLIANATEMLPLRYTLMGFSQERWTYRGKLDTIAP